MLDVDLYFVSFKMVDLDSDKDPDPDYFNWLTFNTEHSLLKCTLNNNKRILSTNVTYLIFISDANVIE